LRRKREEGYREGREKCYKEKGVKQKGNEDRNKLRQLKRQE
jgi:hypothetical protein